MIHHDLLWYYGGDAQGDLGLHGTVLEPTVRSTNNILGPDDHQLDAAARYRRISQALDQLSPEHLRTLRLVHTPLLPGIGAQYGGKPLKELVGVVLATYDREMVGNVLRASHALTQVGRTVTALVYRDDVWQVVTDTASSIIADWTREANGRARVALRAYREAEQAVRADRAAEEEARSDAWAGWARGLLRGVAL